MAERYDVGRFDRAEALFEMAEKYPSAVPLERRKTVLRLRTHPSQWLVQEPKDGKVLIRRVEWDPAHNVMEDWKGDRSFCADALADETLLLDFVSSLATLNCPLIGVDLMPSWGIGGKIKHLEFERNMCFTKLCWWTGSVTVWGPLNSWFDETVDRLEHLLPVSTVRQYRYEAHL